MKKIHLNHITKIEGHAELDVKIKDSKVEKVNLKVFEGPRFFEAIVKGRKYDEVPFLTSRICGVCSIAHLLTSIMAVEDAMGVQVSEQTNVLRELLYNGNLIQSHVLHLFFLTLPDYLGFPNAIAMAGKHKDKLNLALKLKQLGNEFVSLIGGRELHAITPVVGGFSKLPSAEKLSELLVKLKDARAGLEDELEIFLEMSYPELSRKSLLFSLVSEDTYPVVNGKIGCQGDTCIEGDNYDKYFREFIKKGSTSKTVLFENEPFMVGALARVYHNKDMLSPAAQKFLEKLPGGLPENNPFYNNAAQAIELVHLFDRCIELLEKLKPEKEGLCDVKVAAGRGVAVTEAPRGLLFHDYKFDKNGYVEEANIIPPTTQNLKRMEDDIKLLLPAVMHKKKNEIVLDIEKLIRAYDPCISCSAHFLKVNWDMV